MNILLTTLMTVSAFGYVTFAYSLVQFAVATNHTDTQIQSTERPTDTLEKIGETR